MTSRFVREKQRRTGLTGSGKGGGIRKVDRDDARFIAAALDSRISGDREALDLLARSDAVALMASAAVLEGAAADWPPAVAGAAELRAIARHGSAAIDAGPPVGLKKLVDSLRKLAGEAPIAVPRNRAERRAAATIILPRRQRPADVLPVVKMGTLH